jgi:choline transport protein
MTNTKRHGDAASQLEAKGVGETFDLDDTVLRAQGHEVQLERSFSWMGALGLAFRFALVQLQPEFLLIMFQHCQFVVDLCFMLWSGI